MIKYYCFQFGGWWYLWIYGFEACERSFLKSLAVVIRKMAGAHRNVPVQG